MDDIIHSLILSKLNNHIRLRNEFAVMSIDEFIGIINPEFHYKNKFFLVFLFSEGQGSLVIDHQEYTIKAHQYFFLNYNQFYHFKAIQAQKGCVMMFTKSFYNHIYTGNKLIKSDSILPGISPSSHFKGENRKSQWQIFEEIKKEYQSDKLLSKEVICLLVKVFVLKYIQNSQTDTYPERSVSHQKELVDQFSDLIDKYYKELKTTSPYAKKLNISGNYLNAIVKEKLDITAGQLIKNRVILEAERLLLHTSMSITEISYELGFNDNSHFGKYFKSAKKMTPKVFRSENI